MESMQIAGTDHELILLTLYVIIFVDIVCLFIEGIQIKTRINV